MSVFRIGTFNVENLGKLSAPGPSLEERLLLLRPQLLRLRADVVCLQEVDSQRGGAGQKRRLEALDALLTGTPYQSFHRAHTMSRRSGAVRDKHNLIILSRFPVVEYKQLLHDLVAPPLFRRVPTDGDGKADATTPQAVEWDRPILYARLQLAGGQALHVVNVHLRAPRAAFIAGQKSDSQTWRSMPGWAEGFFLAAVKRSGQALEARLLIDRLFDADPGALIIVCGDFNADGHEVPVRIIRGDEEDAGNPHLAERTLVDAARSLARSQRFSVVHHGRPQMLDHVLVSRQLLGWYRGIEVHNEALGDELMTPQAVRGSLESFHAPIVAEFDIPETSAG
jgi:endonuclease/exonuclease/phosphatase family metal-dependent hydrolase